MCLFDSEQVLGLPTFPQYTQVAYISIARQLTCHSLFLRSSQLTTSSTCIKLGGKSMKMRKETAALLRMKISGLLFLNGPHIASILVVNFISRTT